MKVAEPMVAGFRLSGLSRQIGCAALFLCLLIGPFILFGSALEVFVTSAMTDGVSDALAIVVAGILLAGDPVLPTPSSLVATLLAAKVGFVRAAITNAAALSLACVFGYVLGRGGERVLTRFGFNLPDGFVGWVRRNGLVAVLLCRPVPVLAEASLILAGAAQHEPRRLLAWSCLTQAILGVIYAYSGSGWGQSRFEAAAVFTGAVLVPVLGAAIVAAALYRERKKSQHHIGQSAQGGCLPTGERAR